MFKDIKRLKHKKNVNNKKFEKISTSFKTPFIITFKHSSNKRRLTVKTERISNYEIKVKMEIIKIVSNADFKVKFRSV